MIDRLALNAGGLERREGSHAGVVMNSSQELAARARTGDHDAFRLLFERYAVAVLGFIYHMVGRYDVAEELTQETFVRAYRNLHAFRDEAKFSTWLFGIGKNVAREWGRANRQMSTTEATEPESNLADDATINSPADQLMRKELQAALVRAMQSLDEDKRTVFALKVFQQLSYQEIVDITGFSLARVKTELHRARNEIRQQLRPYLETK